MLLWRKNYLLNRLDCVERHTFSKVFLLKYQGDYNAFGKFIVATTLAFITSNAIAEPIQKPVDLGELYARFEESGHSSLELMETTKRVLISGVAFDISQSFSGNSIFKFGSQGKSQELARLTAADDNQENNPNTLQAGSKFKAICDLTFSSGTQYMSFQRCIFNKFEYSAFN